MSNTIFCDESILDRGVVLSKGSGNLRFHEYFTGQLSEAVEMVFTNKLSGKEIYYTGVDIGGDGIYWIKDGQEKKEIQRVFTKYLPSVRWYGENIAEMFGYGNLSNLTMVYYNFRHGTITEVYMPVFVDANSRLVVGSIFDELVLVNLDNGGIIRRMNIFTDINIERNKLIRYNFKIENNKIIINYQVYGDNDTMEINQGTITYEFTR